MLVSTLLQYSFQYQHGLGLFFLLGHFGHLSGNSIKLADTGIH